MNPIFRFLLLEKTSCRSLSPPIAISALPSYFIALFATLFVSTSFANPRPAWPPWPEQTLGLYRFDLDWYPPLLAPAIGFEDASVQESWSQYALIRDGLSLVPVAIPNIDGAGRRTLADSSGAVHFWFSPNWSSVRLGGTGPGHYARLLELVDLSGSSAQVRWSLYFDEDGDTLYLSGVGANGRAKDFLKTQIEVTAGEWELFTLKYDPKATELWLGDQMVAKGNGVPAPTQWQEPALGLVIGSDLAVTDPANGLFEELATFDYWPDEEQLQFYYNGVSRQVLLGTIGTPEEEAAKQELLAELYPQPLMTLEESGGMIAMAYSYSTNELWLEITNASNGLANLIIHNTEPWTTYEILSKEALTNAAWLSETNVLAVEGRDWTPADILMGDRTNTLFFRARSYADDDGDGLPDWWELENGLDPTTPDTGNTGVSDGYKDGDNDDWSNLQEYQNGTNPGGFDTPPAPQGVTARLNPSGPGAVVSWLPSGSAVMDYVVETHPSTYITNTDPAIIDSSAALPTGFYYAGQVPFYRVMAQYPRGNSSWSDYVSLYEGINPAEALIVYGTGGTPVLQVRDMPAETTAIRLWDSFIPTNVTVSVSPVDGTDVVDLPSWTGESGYTWNFQQVVRSNGLATASESVQSMSDFDVPYWDGRTQLLQNLSYQLRAADWSLPFEVTSNLATIAYYPNYWDYSDAYVVSSFYELDGLDSSPDELKPYRDNNRFRNFCYASPPIINGSGALTTGVYEDTYAWLLFLEEPATFQFVSSSNPVLSSAESQWIYQVPVSYYDDFLEEFILPRGVSYEQVGSDLYWTMEQYATNDFGLRYLSTVLAENAGGQLRTALLLAGETNIVENLEGVSFYSEVEEPELDNVGYYFAKVGRDQLPGLGGFYNSATNQIIVTSVGRSVRVAGYAKLAIANGYANKFAYLGQYFDKAYKADESGMATTNETGYLSLYGEFFPTEPGRVILTTMPDGVSTNVGQCTVYVISLDVDANHDGKMDRTYTGPDHTPSDQPFVFWANNDFDRPALDEDDAKYYNDDVKTEGCPYTPNKTTPDFDYRDSSGNRAISSQRDLEDFARLWVSGVDSTTLTNLPSNSVITLSWGDPMYPDPNSPTIDLFAAYETDGGSGYLTNSAVSLLQTYLPASPYVGRVGPNQSLQLNAGYFTNGWAGNHFIWCGVSNGIGPLTLTIADGSGNTMAQSVTYIQITDVQQMYERWTIGDNPSMTPATNAVLATENLPVGTPGFQYSRPKSGDIPYILFVHGWNMERWEKDRFAEAAFKRLYWQGYKGRFGLFRWPTDNGFQGNLWDVVTDSHNYDNSENTAWRSAIGLLNKLNDLHTTNPDHVYLLAHSMGNVTAGEALRLSGTNQVVNTYVASQAAIPAHVYDSTSTNLIDFTHKHPRYPFNPPNFGPTTPNIYGDWLAGNSGAVGRRINFYNANDFALSPDAWCFNQELKPDDFLSGHYAYFGSTNDPAPWNNFAFVPTFGDTVNLDIVNQILDRYEAMAFAAESYSKAFGATAGVSGLSDTLNLMAVWPTDTTGHNYADHFWHSAQFRGESWQGWDYWRTLLRSDSQGFDIQDE